VSIVQPLSTYTSWQCERYFKLHPFGYPKDGWRFSLHKTKRTNVFDYRLHGPIRSINHKTGSFTASDELTILIVLMTGQLVPVGVVADKIEEEFPHLSLLTDMMREWEEHERFQDALKLRKKNANYMEGEQ
jgi:hypothetical protein